MLKIAKGIDLKELKKYGFKRTGDEFGYEYVRFYERRLDDDEDFLVRVYEHNRYIFIEHKPTYEIDDMNLSYDFEILYDLIKDGIVEKEGKE